jgi:DNA-binding response OmpR family regulator
MTTHILIVDDDPLHAKLLTFLFADAGYQAAVLADPRGIDPFLRDRAVDLILLGVARPSTAGFNVCAQLRDGHPDMPVILLMGARHDCRPRLRLPPGGGRLYLQAVRGGGAAGTGAGGAATVPARRSRPLR